MKNIRDMLVDELKAASLHGGLSPKTVAVFASTLDLCEFLKKADVAGTPDQTYAIAVAHEAQQDALLAWLKEHREDEL